MAWYTTYEINERTNYIKASITVRYQNTDLSTNRFIITVIIAKYYLG